jgi:hypothetical protein
MKQPAIRASADEKAVLSALREASFCPRSDVDRELTTWAFSVPRTPEFEHVLPKAFVNRLDNWRYRP